MFVVLGNEKRIYMCICHDDGNESMILTELSKTFPKLLITKAVLKTLPKNDDNKYVSMFLALYRSEKKLVSCTDSL